MCFFHVSMFLAQAISRDLSSFSDYLLGRRCCQEPLPPTPLSGMLNRTGGKVRLTFKLECDQLWIGTKERTEKVSMSSVKAVVSEPITGHEEYHIMVS